MTREVTKRKGLKQKEKQRKGEVRKRKVTVFVAVAVFGDQGSSIL